MATVADLIDDYFPANNDIAVPLKSTISVLFDREMNEAALTSSFFVTGPDTDTFVGPDINLQVDPENVSEGDDFLASPGYTGMVSGTITFKKISTTDPDVEVQAAPYRTKLIFTPTRPMGVLTQYTAHLPEVTDLVGTVYEGYYTFSWTTGSGSIQALPSTGSSSVLRTSGQPTETLSLLKTTPADHAVEIDPETKTIVLEFSKVIDPSTVTLDKFTVTAIDATDHPKVPKSALGDIAKSVSVQGSRVTIHI